MKNIYIICHAYAHTNQGSYPMARKKKGEGFHSAAGLIRYFDAEEETAPKINPWLVVVAGIISVIILEILHRHYPL
jgi:preprotein translocase subunit Sec61beta